MALSALILEDSPVQAKVIGQMLAGLGWTCFHCATIREATEALAVIEAGVLLLDVHVGQHNSLLHLERFRKLAPGARIILMTAGLGGEVGPTLAAARGSGADFVLQKPFTQSVLAGVFDNVEKHLLSGGTRKHLLVIDDSRTVCHFVKNGLDESQFRVSIADSMESAFDSVDIAHVDVVLCDVFMPGMGGLEGIRHIKATWPGVPVISMSGGYDGHMGEADALAAARKIGADAALAKPFNASTLTTLIGDVLNAAERRRMASLKATAATDP